MDWFLIDLVFLDREKSNCITVSFGVSAIPIWEYLIIFNIAKMGK